MDEKFLNKIVELQNLFDEGVVTTADNIPQPEPRQEVLDREAVNAFMKRNPMAGGGMLVQPTVDGSRPGYKTKKGYIAPLPQEMKETWNTISGGKDWNDTTSQERANFKYTFKDKKQTLDKTKGLISQADLQKILT